MLKDRLFDVVAFVGGPVLIAGSLPYDGRWQDWKLLRRVLWGEWYLHPPGPKGYFLIGVALICLGFVKRLVWDRERHD